MSDLALHHSATCWRIRHELRRRARVLDDALAAIGTDVEEFYAEHDRRGVPAPVRELLDAITASVAGARAAAVGEEFALAVAQDASYDDDLRVFGARHTGS